MLRAQDSELPLRPGYGNAGQRLKVIANHFPFIAFPSGNIHHYDIDIVPGTVIISCELLLHLGRKNIPLIGVSLMLNFCFV
ncbi:hypothetical protein BKA69DRAFT_1175728 [Paraphysoderma sedebokerense]|nr:hypothetical protein BKA69DRAFT_1175728 [Paraphysoderma sedebokerense]